MGSTLGLCLVIDNVDKSSTGVSINALTSDLYIPDEREVINVELALVLRSSLRALLSLYLIYSI